MPEWRQRYEISLPIAAPPERVSQIMTSLDQIRIWEPAHRLPFIRHEWIPAEGRLRPGSICLIRSPLWTFTAICREVSEERVWWEFLSGPLRGNEYWEIRCSEGGCEVLKVMDCSIDRLWDKVWWKILGRPIHDWASLRQLRSIKELAEVSPGSLSQ